MELLETTRRYFKFDCDKSWEFDFDDIQAGQGKIRFQRPAIHETHRWEFDTVESCKLWILEREAAMKMGFEADKRVDKKLYDIKSTALPINDREWALVSQYMTNPDRFDRAKEEIKIFEAYLANNFRDRDGERFSKDVLRAFEKTLVGKGKLMGHKWGDPGNGRFYYAKLLPMTAEEAIDFIGVNPDKKFKEHLDHIVEKEGAIYWLVTKYYMPNITDLQKEAIIYIESGVWKDMSIGFRAPRKFAIYKNGEEKEVSKYFDSGQEANAENPILYLEFRNDKDLIAEALEGSHVFLGAQYGAGTTKTAEELESKLAEIDEKLGQLKELSGLSEAIRKLADSGRQSSTANQQETEEQQSEEVIEEWVDGATIDDADIKFYVTALDALILKNMTIGDLMKAVWNSSYVKSLENNCFAFCEDTGKEDDEGRTIPNSARHLPHHAKGNGASGTGGTVDLPHLRNALARVNQTKPVTDTISAAELQSKAKAHLIAHAKKEGIGDYESMQDSAATTDQANITNDNKGSEVAMKKFNFEALDVKMTVSDEKFEDDLKVLQEALMKRQDAFDQKLADLDQQIKDANDRLAQNDEAIKAFEAQKTELEGFKKMVSEVFGDSVKLEDLKQTKETAKAFRDFEINERFIKFKGLLGLIDKEEDELDILKDLNTAQITKMANYYQNNFYKVHPEYNPKGILNTNTEVINTVTGKPGNEVPKEIEQPRAHYRL